MKWRVMAALMAVTLLALLVQDVPLSQYMRQAEHDRIIASLERDALVLASRAEEPLRSGTAADFSTVTQIAKAYHTAGGARVIITDARGIAVFTSDSDDSVVGTSYLSRPEIGRSLSGQITTGTRYSKTLSETLLYVAVPVLSGTDVYGAVRLTYPDRVITDRVNAQLGLLALAALTAVILAGLVGYLLSVSIARALNRLRATTEQFAGGSLDQRADESHGAAELRSLARSFNVMAERLHALIAQQRAFASDASHQLRTPLTALKLRLERARELTATDPAAATTRLVAAEAEVDRLSDIIEGLLRLSRAEALDEPVEPVDLVATARERIDHWQPLANETNVRIELIAPPASTVLAIPLAPGQILDNFIDNALAVAPKESSIEIVITVNAEGTVLAVLDRGPGLGEADRERAFDRFWRGNLTGGGSGLGLAIVAQLATASGAIADVNERDGRGLVASVRFVSGDPSDRRRPSPKAESSRN
jgi:signal transduction histidine kinase